MHNQLAQHAVVVRRHHTARVQMAVQTNPRPPGRRVERHTPRRRRKATRGILRVQTHLNGVTRHPDVILAQPQRLAQRNPYLHLHQIHARHHLRHRMLHLNARVHLHEAEPPLPIQQILNRTRATVVDAARRTNRRRAHLRAKLRRERRARRLLDQLLVTPLQTAVAITKVNHMTLAVPHHLHLHVLRRHRQLLHEHRAVPKRLLRLARRRAEQTLQVTLALHHAHPLAATTRRRLQHHRIPQTLRARIRRRHVRQHPVAPRRHRHPRLHHHPTRHRLVAQRTYRLRRRPDEHKPTLPAQLRKLGALRQKPIPGMYRRRTRQLRRRQNAVRPQIAVRRARPANAHRLVRQTHRQRVAVRLRIHHHARQPQLTAGPHHPQRYLAAVRYQDFRPHRRLSSPSSQTAPCHTPPPTCSAAAHA